MSPEWHMDDDTIDVIVQGAAPADDTLVPLLSFARQVQEVGDAPPPAPSAELAALLDGSETVSSAHSTGLHRPAGLAPAATPDDGPLVAAGQARQSTRRRRMPLVETAVAKVAGLGLAAKIGLGATATAAVATTAGATGVGPQPMNDVVRGGISTVTPLNLDADGADAGAGAGADVDAGSEVEVDAGVGAEADVSEDGVEVDAGAGAAGTTAGAGAEVDADGVETDLNGDGNSEVDVNVDGSGVNAGTDVNGDGNSEVDVNVDDGVDAQVDLDGDGQPDVDADVDLPRPNPELPDSPAPNLPVPTTLP